MPDARECRALAAEYEARPNAAGTTKRLANVLMSVSRNYASLAAQLELFEKVEKDEATRIALQKRVNATSE